MCRRREFVSSRQCRHISNDRYRNTRVVGRNSGDTKEVGQAGGPTPFTMGGQQREAVISAPVEVEVAAADRGVANGPVGEVDEDVG